MNSLNPNAQPFKPAHVQAPQERAGAAQHARARGRAPREERSLFMTFSSGSPLTWQEIHDHFTKEFGNCVEYVHVNKQNNRDPEYGRITFTTPDMPNMMLGHEAIVEIEVNGKPVWLKKYVPHHRRISC